MNLTDLATDDLITRRAELRAAHAELVASGLKLDLTRGKPSPEQLDLAEPMLTILAEGEHRAADGTDCRNYGNLRGLPELRAMLAEVFGVPADQIVTGGNSSLALMHDCVVNLLLNGPVEGTGRWVDQPKVAMLTPVPGYDRHFGLSQRLGVEMIPVPLTDAGPDLDVVRELVAADARIRGMWCVPKYSNPTGVTYSEETVRALASMPTAAPDFKLFWDNAYAVHDLTEHETPLADVLAAAEAAGNPDRPLVFGSTSKITWAGAGVGFFGGSPRNVAWLLAHLEKRTIGPDKVSELRHVRFLPDAAHVRAHMAAHRAIIAPKFAAVDAILTEGLGGLGIASWTKPAGGYFISLDVPDGCAKRVVSLAAEAGVAITPAGATFPYGADPRDRNIRIAPTYPVLADVQTATRVLVACVLLAAVDSVLEQRQPHPVA